MCSTQKTRERRVAFVLLFCIFGRVSCDFFQPFVSNAPVFSENKLYGVEVGLGEFSGHVACMGDFNGDKFSDLILVTEQKNEVKVAFWDHDTFSFSFAPAVSIHVENSTVVSVSVSDFNRDGHLDVLVTSMGVAAPSYDVRLYLGYLESVQEVGALIATVKGEVLLMDANNDMAIDLFGTDSATGARSYWLNDGKAQFKRFTQPGDTLPPLSVPHSNAFADVNGDCLPDLFVNTEGKWEVWVNRHSGNVEQALQPAHTFVAPQNAGQATFADYDGDGTLDVVVPICEGVDCAQSSIVIVFNPSGCGSTCTICTTNDAFSFDAASLALDADSPNRVIVKPEALSFFQFLRSDDIPVTLRTGDYDLDGYVDLIAVVRNNTDSPTFPVLLHNVPCDFQLCSSEAVVAGRRTFVLVTEGVDALGGIQNAYAAFFFDLDEDGLTDIFVLSDPSLTTSASATSLPQRTPRVSAVFNNLFTNDAFFLKVLGLNGVCYAFCDKEPAFPKPKPVGVNMVGVTFQYTITDFTGNRRTFTVSQLPQSAYLALSSPSNLIGLGRITTMIEELAMGVPTDSVPHFKKWDIVVPNSQLVAFPYPVDEAEKWKLDLYVSPSSKVLWVCVWLVSSLVILLALIGLLTWREKRQDEQEKRENAHLFSFNAM